MFLCLLLVSAPLAAQERGEPTPPPATDAPAGTKPHDDDQADVIWLKDENGTLRAVYGMTLEELDRLLRRARNLTLAEGPPPYVLQHLKLSGQASGQHARLRMVLSVRLRGEKPKDPWVAVPLGLANAILREPVESSTQRVEVDPKGGYVAWLRGDPDSQHILTLDVLAPLVQADGQTVLRLAVPRATISAYKFDVPTPGAIGRISDNATMTSQAGPEAGTTRFEGAGLRGEFELAWSAPQPSAGMEPTALEATGGVISVRIDDRIIRSKAQLNVKSFGSPFQRFRVRLPPGATLASSPHSGYTVSEVDEPAASDSQSKPQPVVEVRLDQAQVGPVRVVLEAKQTREKNSSNQLVELAGFQVLGAVHEWGHLAVEVVGDWHVLWRERRNIRQIAALPDELKLPEDVRSSNLVAAFEYFSQPCSLSAQLVPRTTRTRVVPNYTVEVSPRKAVLTGQLNYTIQGKKVFRLVIDHPGWQDVEVGPDDLIAVDRILMESDRISVPLKQATTGTIQLTIKASREIPDVATTIEFSLPKFPEASSQSAATLKLQADDNVELTPLKNQMHGLTRQQLARSLEPSHRQQEPLFYRAEETGAHFVAARRVQARSVSTAVDSHVQLERERGSVEQTITYQVSYEPMDRVTLAVPAGLASSERPEVTLDGKSLTLVPVEAGTPIPARPEFDAQPPIPPTVDTPPQDTTDGLPAVGRLQPSAGRPILMRAVLPAPRIGRWRLKLRFAIDVAEPPQTLVVPLIMPTDGNLGTNNVTVAAEPNLRVSYFGELWSRPDREHEANRSVRLSLEALSPIHRLPLQLDVEEQLAAGSTTIERAWLQTWLVGSGRQDRVCYRFSSRENRLRLSLPEGVRPSDVEVRLDGALAPRATSSGRRLSIELPRDAGGRQHRLELRYQFPVYRRPASGSLSLDAPRLEHATWIGPVRWELVLPPGEHLFAADEQFTPDFEIRRRGLFWVRQPTHEQSELEAWSGASRAESVPASSNRYLFVTLQAPERFAVRTVPRSLLVLVASLIALAAGLALIYVRALRNWGILFAAAVAMGAWVVIDPPSALLAAQAAVLGLGLMLLGAALRYLLSRRVPRPVTSFNSPSGYSSAPGSTQPYGSIGYGAGSSSAATSLGHTERRDSLSRREQSAESGLTS